MLTSTFDYEEQQQKRYASEVVDSQVAPDYYSGIEAAELARRRTADNSYL